MKKNIAIIGAQFGDEGKGKVVDYTVDAMRCYIDSLPFSSTGYSKSTGRILNYRWQGGKNAGHIVVKEGIIYPLHQIPSGILTEYVTAFLGKGMYVHSRALVDEIDGLRKKGVRIGPHNFGISSQAHMTLDYHTLEDQGCFNLAEHSSTGSGIKQTARDKANRVGIRFVEFLDSKLMLQILEEKVLPELKLRHNVDEDYFKKLVTSYQREREELAPFLKQENQVFSSSEFIFGLGEGAQGIGLDMDSGFYPGITSSNPSQPTHKPNEIIGVLKSYLSSVGMKDRPFITEMPTDLQKLLVDEWFEKGTTTGRTRHIGCFDALYARYAIEAAQMDTLALTCLDRLETLGRMGQKIKVAVAYEVNGKTYDEWDVSFDRRDTLWNAKPVYLEFDSWTKTRDSKGGLTDEAARYVENLEKLIGKEISLIGVGRSTNDMIVRKNILE